MSKVIGWDYCLGITGMHLVGQDLCAGYCSPLPYFSIPDSQWLGPVDSPEIPGDEIRVVAWAE